MLVFTPFGSCSVAGMSHLCAPQKDATSRQNATNRDMTTPQSVIFPPIFVHLRSSAVKLYRAENLNFGHLWSRLVTFGHLWLVRVCLKPNHAKCKRGKEKVKSG